MKTPRYYALRLYGHGPFPRFIDSFRTLAVARQWANLALKEGYHTVEILRDSSRKPGYFGVGRELIDTVQRASHA